MNQRGFTLTEIMIATATASILMAGIFGIFTSQQRIRADQRRVVQMQQNLRSTLSLLQTEIRMAGYDPSWTDAGDDGLDDRRLTDGIDNDCDGQTDQPADVDEDRDGAGIVKAGAHHLQIRLDRDGNADFCGSRELVAYGFANTADRNRDGIADAGTARLNRGFKDRALNQPVGENLQAVGFAYAFDRAAPAGWPDGNIDTEGQGIIWAYDADGDGQLDTALDTDQNGIIEPADDTNADGVLNDRPLDQTVPLTSIRAVQVWLLGRTRTPIRGQSPPGVYVVGSIIVAPPAGDRHRRMLLTGIVACRNLGLR
jgi:type IV pilus assembly protein PilW